MSLKLCELEASAKRAQRNIVAKWAEELILEKASMAAGYAIDIKNESARVEALRNFALEHVTDKQLASIERDGEGDPNPVLITDKALEQVVGGTLVFLRDYVVEVATVEAARHAAISVLECGRFETDEGKGLQIDKLLTKKVVRLAYDLSQRWSWKALKIYRAGDDLDEEEEEGESSGSEHAPDECSGEESEEDAEEENEEYDDTVPAALTDDEDEDEGEGDAEEVREELQELKRQKRG